MDSNGDRDIVRESRKTKILVTNNNNHAKASESGSSWNLQKADQRLCIRSMEGDGKVLFTF